MTSSRERLGEPSQDPRTELRPEATLKAVALVTPSTFESDPLSESGLALAARRGAGGLVLVEERGETDDDARLRRDLRSRSPRGHRDPGDLDAVDALRV